MPDRNAITIGNFDGVHLGHVHLVRAARQAIGRHGSVIVLSFDPHPSTVLRPQDAVARLSSFEQRRQWLKAAGADDVLLLEPTGEFLNQSPQSFLDEVTSRFKPSMIVEGADFRFGRGRAGSIETLHEAQRQLGYRTIIVEFLDAVLADQAIVRVSSTMIRWLLQRGRVRDAQMLLGRPYELHGQVIRGDRRGREIGVPTINIQHGDYVLPADGIYAGLVELPDGNRFAAAISIGTKPTFGTHARICEAHLIGYHGPLDHYDWFVRLQFHEWVRDQLTFSNVDQLIDQMQRDIARVEFLMRRRLAASRQASAVLLGFPSATKRSPVGARLNRNV